jgi:hypothetical protein
MQHALPAVRAALFFKEGMRCNFFNQLEIRFKCHALAMFSKILMALSCCCPCVVRVAASTVCSFILAVIDLGIILLHRKAGRR